MFWNKNTSALTLNAIQATRQMNRFVPFCFHWLKTNITFRLRQKLSLFILKFYEHEITSDCMLVVKWLQFISSLITKWIRRKNREFETGTQNSLPNLDFPLFCSSTYTHIPFSVFRFFKLSKPITFIANQSLFYTSPECTMYIFSESVLTVIRCITLLFFICSAIRLITYTLFGSTIRCWLLGEHCLWSLSQTCNKWISLLLSHCQPNEMISISLTIVVDCHLKWKTLMIIVVIKFVYFLPTHLLIIIIIMWWIFTNLLISNNWTQKIDENFV